MTLAEVIKHNEILAQEKEMRKAKKLFESYKTSITRDFVEHKEITTHIHLSAYDLELFKTYLVPGYLSDWLDSEGLYIEAVSDKGYRIGRKEVFIEFVEAPNLEAFKDSIIKSFQETRYEAVRTS